MKINLGTIQSCIFLSGLNCSIYNWYWRILDFHQRCIQDRHIVLMLVLSKDALCIYVKFCYLVTKQVFIRLSLKVARILKDQRIVFFFVTTVGTVKFLLWHVCPLEFCYNVVSNYFQLHVPLIPSITSTPHTFYFT